VQNWTAAWRASGLAGVAQGRHRGRARCLDAEAETRLSHLLQEGDPQAHGDAATGWTVALRRAELAQRGWAAAQRTIRRALHRLGWRWKRPTFVLGLVLGRPDPADAEKNNPR
jgi:transposase